MRPKTEWREILIMYRAEWMKKHEGASAGTKAWSDELLKLQDKVMQLEGTTALIQSLALVDMGDHLPADMHYRPLLRRTMVLKMLEVDRVVEIDRMWTHPTHNEHKSKSSDFFMAQSFKQ